MINRMEPAATIAVALSANTTLQVSSNRRLVFRGGPSIEPGGMMMLGPPNWLWPRGTEAVTGKTSMSPNRRSFGCRVFPNVCPNSHRSAEQEQGRRHRSGATPAACAATFRTIDAALSCLTQRPPASTGRPLNKLQPSQVLCVPVCIRDFRHSISGLEMNTAAGTMY